MFDSKRSDHVHSHAQNRFAVIPTADRLKADPQYSGRGLRIAFLDSGFYPHPDFVDRIVAFHDIAGEERSLAQIITPATHHWHGMQTVTTCAGDGALSNGIYRGLAHRAQLVLVKVSRQGGIGDVEIEAGLQWVIANRQKYDIRILNISLGGDCDLPSAESRINLLIEELVSDGVVVTVAAGNSDTSRSLPPASASTAITVGGYNDENTLAIESYGLYHSSYGETADGLVKPELIAPAMYVAAPILPATPEYVTAEILSMLVAAPDYSFPSLLTEFWDAAGLGREIIDQDIDTARKVLENELRERRVIATHYQHVDGTSFAAPIAASVVAQMLEANPNLTPAAVKNIFISTAVKLGGHPAVRQGFGLLNASAAVEMARSERHALNLTDHHPPRVVNSKIAFTFHDDSADRVSLAGDFNDWRPDQAPLERSPDGIWRVSIPCQPAGSYRYKFLIDNERWTEDPSHLLKIEDGFGGFNSILQIAKG
jgi:serine protease AprX